MPEDFIVRPMNENNQSDYQALASLYKYAYPEEHATSTGLKVADAVRTGKFVCRRWLAEQNGIIKGVGCFEHWESYYHPHKYLLHVIVAPQFQRQGIGSALYRFAISRLEKEQPESVQTWVQKERGGSVRFAEKCGFVKAKLKWNFALDIQSCNLELFIKQLEILDREGIEIKPLSAFRNNTEHDRKHYDLYVRTVRSIETADEAPIPGFEEFIKQKMLESEELTFIAAHDNRYVGMWKLDSESSTELFGGIMSVDQSYRHRGVALGLTIRALQYAKTNHYSNLTVHTDEHNKAVLKLTEKLGFTQLPAQILFTKKFAEL